MRGRTNGRPRRLLTDHEVSEHDAKIVYAALLLLHGYGWPNKTRAAAEGCCSPTTVPPTRLTLPMTVAVEGSARWRLAITVVAGERPPRGVDGGRSRLRVYLSDCACQAGNQAEVDEKGAEKMTLLRLSAPASKLL
jgi:hypothetical protein